MPIVDNTFVFKQSDKKTSITNNTFIFSNVKEEIDASSVMYAGAYMSSIITTSSITDYYDGATLETTLQTYVQYAINTTIYQGSRVDFTLTDRKHLPVEYRSGAYMLTDLKYSAVYSEPSDCYAGENVDVVITGQTNIPVEMLSGAELVTNPTFTGQINVVSVSYTGASVNFDMQSSLNPSFVCTGGSTLSTTITTTQYIPADLYTGSLLDTTLQTYANITFTCDYTEGCELLTSVSTTTQFSPVVYIGGALAFDMNTFPLTGIDCIVPMGASLSFDIKTSKLFAPLMYHGHSVQTVVENTIPFEVTSTSTSGGNLLLNDLYYSFSLKSFTHTDGSTLSLTALDELPNYTIFNGESLDTNIAMEIVLGEQTLYSGDTLQATLSTYESQPVGVFTMSSGSRVDVSMKALRSLDFKVRMSHSTEFTIDRWKSKNVQLGTKCCRKENKHNTLTIDLYSKPMTELYTGRAIVGSLFEADLSITRLFKPTMSAGSTFTVDFMKYDSYSVNSGDRLTADLYTERTTRLTSGNLQYNGFVVYELEKVLTDTTTLSEQYLNGSTLITKLSHHNQESVSSRAGEYITSEISIIEADRFTMLHGQTLNTTISTNIQFDFSMRSGTNLSMSFYQPPVIIESGSNLSVTELVTTYEVEFLEKGNLINEHVDVDEFGVPRPTDTDESSIEGRLFEHFVRGRCY